VRLLDLFPVADPESMGPGCYLVASEDGAVWIGDFFDHCGSGELYLRGEREPMHKWSNPIVGCYGPIDELELWGAIRESSPNPIQKEGE